MSDGVGPEFRRVFARRALQMLAGRRTFERGAAYAADRRVKRVRTTLDGARATVRGSATYDIELWIDDDEPGCDCSCPVGGDGRLCKHAVAVALVVTGADITEEVLRAEEATVDLADHLRGLDHEVLVELILERAAHDELFDGRLRMAAAHTGTGHVALEPFRHAVDNAFDTGGYIGYREAYAYTNGIESVLDSLERLLQDGYADEVRSLAERAADLAEEALSYLDDSDGGMSGVAARIGDLHVAACVASRPDPVALARTLFERERHEGDLEIFHGAVRVYAEVLGDDGLAEYRRLAQDEWDALPACGPDDEHTWSSSRYRITTMMEALADLTGDVDAVVAVLARDQSVAYQFVRIVETLLEAGRPDDAMRWAQDGLSAHGFGDHRLVELAAELHHRAGRSTQAVDALWSAFDAAPGVDTYQRLARHAERASVWSERRARALTLLRERIGSASPGRYGPTNSTLVAVLLLEGRTDEAWVAAQAGGCHRSQWLELAAVREADHPEDALPIWREEVDRLIAVMNNQSYADAVAMTERVARVMAAAGRGGQFTSYVAGLRETHRRKRNLMKLFADRGW